MGSKKKNSKVVVNGDAASTDAAAQVSGGKRNGGKVITDSRFASVHSDPRFQNLPKHTSKVAIDSRFDRMFTDKSFSSSSALIDKRGKAKKSSLQKNPLKHYYRLEEEEEDGKDEHQKKKLKGVPKSEEDESDGESSEESEIEIEKEKLKKRVDELSESEPESESESESPESEEEEAESDSSSTHSTDSDEEDDVSSEDEETLVPEENIPEIDKETHRLAVVNLDWSQIKAEDLYVLLSSFLPKGGQILSVNVYPSEFGLKRMEEEAKHGPIGLFDDDKEQNDDENDDDEIDEVKLRAYELSRLRYYYAVVECDSIATADYLYKSCDGVEFERSSNKLDLRFIPDSMEFKHPPRDVATEAPSTYEGVDFQTRALQQSNIQLTWDEDEPHRAKTLKRKFNADQLAELELKEFLASDESDSDEEETDNDEGIENKSGKRKNKKDIYRALIQSGEGSEGEDAEEEGQDMEVTFNTGLEDISKRILEKKDRESETVWEAYLRKRKEKKKNRKNKSADSSEDESSDDTDHEAPEQPDDFFVEEEPSKDRNGKLGKGDKKRKQQKEAAPTKETEASTAELELLLADDDKADIGVKGYNLKRKKAKGKNGKEIPNEDKLPTIDYNDTRFSGLFTSPLYALDPTDPQFKRSATYARQLAQKKLKGGDNQEEEEEEEEEMVGKERPTTTASARQEVKVPSEEDAMKKKDKYELSSMVRSIKMKAKNAQLPPKSAKSNKLNKSRK